MCFVLSFKLFIFLQPKVKISQLFIKKEAEEKKNTVSINALEVFVKEEEPHAR